MQADPNSKHFDPAKETRSTEPIQSNVGHVRLCELAKHKLKHGIFHVAYEPSHKTQGEYPSSREVTRWLLSVLSPRQPSPPPKLSRDLEILRRAVSSIVLAADENVLTAEEADAVIHFIAERFATRRIDEVIANVTSPRHGAWFALHGQIEADE
jgi:hypothetical protein